MDDDGTVPNIIRKEKDIISDALYGAGFAMTVAIAVYAYNNIKMRRLVLYERKLPVSFKRKKPSENWMETFILFIS